MVYSLPAQFPSNKAPVTSHWWSPSHHSLHQMGQDKALETGPAPGQSGKEKGHLDTPLRPTCKSHWGKDTCSSCLPCTRKTWALTPYDPCLLQDYGLGMSLRPGGGRYLRGGRRAEKSSVKPGEEPWGKRVSVGPWDTKRRAQGCAHSLQSLQEGACLPGAMVCECAGTSRAHPGQCPPPTAPAPGLAGLQTL